MHNVNDSSLRKFSFSLPPLSLMQLLFFTRLGNWGLMRNPLLQSPLNVIGDSKGFKRKFLFTVDTQIFVAVFSTRPRDYGKIFWNEADHFRKTRFFCYRLESSRDGLVSFADAKRTNRTLINSHEKVKNRKLERPKENPLLVICKKLYFFLQIFREFSEFYALCKWRRNWKYFNWLVCQFYMIYLFCIILAM